MFKDIVSTPETVNTSGLQTRVTLEERFRPYRVLVEERLEGPRSTGENVILIMTYGDNFTELLHTFSFISYMLGPEVSIF